MKPRVYNPRCTVCYKVMKQTPDGTWYCHWKCDPALAKPAGRRRSLHNAEYEKLDAARIEANKILTIEAARKGLAKVDPRYEGQCKAQAKRARAVQERSSPTGCTSREQVMPRRRLEPPPCTICGQSSRKRVFVRISCHQRGGCKGFGCEGCVFKSTDLYFFTATERLESIAWGKLKRRRWGEKQQKAVTPHRHP